MKAKYLTVIFLILSSIFAFGRIIGNEFVCYDDFAAITENQYIKSPITLTNLKRMSTAVVNSTWHPLTLLSLALDWRLFRDKPAGYHLENLLFHIGAVILLFLFLDKTTKGFWPAAFAAAFFALHPLRVESVAWAAERKDVLSMFLGMASVYAYAFYVKDHKRTGYVLSLAMFVLALMAKPVMVTLPFALLLLDYWPLERRPKATASSVGGRECSIGRLWGEKTPFFLFSFAACVLTLWAQNKAGAIVSVESIPLSARVANAIVSYVTYLGKIIWPGNLAVYYPYQYHQSSWQIFLSGLVLVSISLATLSFRKKFPFLFTGWFWYLGTLVPMIGLVQVGQQAMADRYTYLPFIGIAIALTWSISALVKDGRWRKRIFFPVGLMLLFILAMSTRQQCGFWKNSKTLFEHDLGVAGENSVAYFHLGIALYKQGDIKTALKNFQAALRLEPGDPKIYNNIGVLLKYRGRYTEAARYLTEALKLNPAYAEAHYNLGIVLTKQNRLDDAITQYQQAISCNPLYVKAYNNLGIAYRRQGKLRQSERQYLQILKINPELPTAYNNLGVIMWQTGRYDEASAYFKKALGKNPAYANAHENLRRLSEERLALPGSGQRTGPEDF